VATEVDPEAWVINAGTLILAALSLLDGTERSILMPSQERLLKELARMIGSSLRTPPDDAAPKGNS
jgi:hypothetical protein